MKLSEAIRLGAMTERQEFGRFGTPGDSSCALGSAMHAVGSHNLNWLWYWPWMAEPMSWTCPVCTNIYAFAGVMICLNDNHRWTREAIADWVATVEPQDIQNEQTDGGQVEGANRERTGQKEVLETEVRSRKVCQVFSREETPAVCQEKGSTGISVCQTEELASQECRP